MRSKKRWNGLRFRFDRVGGQIVRTAWDVFSSAVRIVTDVALDVGHTAAGFRFGEAQAGAKPRLSEAGMRTVAEAIETSRSRLVRRMEAEVRVELDSLKDLYGWGRRLEIERTERVAVLLGMLERLSLLSQMYREARSLLEGGLDVPAWKRRPADLEGIQSTLGGLETSNAEWERVSCQLIASGTAGLDSRAWDFGPERGLAWASRLAQEARDVREARPSEAATKLAQIGKLTGRASRALALAVAELDIGVSADRRAAWEHELKRQFAEIQGGLLEGEELVERLRQDHRDVEVQIRRLLASTSQSEEGWDGWVIETRDMLRRLRNWLVSQRGLDDQACADVIQAPWCHPQQVRGVSLRSPISPDKGRASTARADS